MGIIKDYSVYSPLMKGISITLLVIGVIAGLYVGIWWGLIGGIIQIVNGFKADDISASMIAYGIAKILFASPLGWLCVLLGAIAGEFLPKDRTKHLKSLLRKNI